MNDECCVTSNQAAGSDEDMTYIVCMYVCCTVYVVQVNLYEDDASQDKSHGAQQTDGDNCFDNIAVCLQVSSAANHAPWIIHRTVARSVRCCDHMALFKSVIIIIVIIIITNTHSF